MPMTRPHVHSIYKSCTLRLVAELHIQQFRALAGVTGTHSDDASVCRGPPQPGPPTAGALHAQGPPLTASQGPPEGARVVGGSVAPPGLSIKMSYSCDKMRAMIVRQRVRACMYVPL